MDTEHKMDKANKKQFIHNLQLLNTNKAIDNYYNLETLYEKGSASYTYKPTEENQIHIKLLVDEFMSINYAFCEEDTKKGYNMRSNLKKLCADGRIEKRRGSHLYREFYNFCMGQKYYNKWNLIMNGGEDSSKSEQMVLKQLRLENEKLKAENNKLRDQNLDIKQKHGVLKKSNAGLRKQLQHNQHNVTIDETKNVERVIEPEPTPEPTPVKKKRPVPPQALLPEECLIESSDSDSESSDEEVEQVVEHPEKKDVEFDYDNPLTPIKWNELDTNDIEKILRENCNHYCEIIKNTYQSEVEFKGGYDSKDQTEIMCIFQNWFKQQEKYIRTTSVMLDLNQIASKFADQLEKSLEFIFYD